MSGVRRFACTICGACCNRAPEVELSEAAALADVFVFRLLFRIYTQPRVFAPNASESSQAFYERKRLLSLHAAQASSIKLMRDGKPVEAVQYLMISALALDTRPGECPALGAGRCTIHDRRPLTCRTVPFHYSRGETNAQADFDAFVSTPGYACDTGELAPEVLVNGRITDVPTTEARGSAADLAEQDRRWKQALVHRMRRLGHGGLPTLEEVEASASYAAVTIPMAAAWQVAVQAAIMSAGEFNAIIEAQLATIRWELAKGRCDLEGTKTLAEMSSDYTRLLKELDLTSSMV